MVVYNTDLLRKQLDEYTRKYLRAQETVISEFSGTIPGDRWTLLREVNADREDFDLEPIEAPDYWTPEEEDYLG